MWRHVRLSPESLLFAPTTNEGYGDAGKNGLYDSLLPTGVATAGSRHRFYIPGFFSVRTITAWSLDNYDPIV